MNVWQFNWVRHFLTTLPAAVGILFGPILWLYTKYLDCWVDCHETFMVLNHYDFADPHFSVPQVRHFACPVQFMRRYGGKKSASAVLFIVTPCVVAMTTSTFSGVLIQYLHLKLHAANNIVTTVKRNVVLFIYFAGSSARITSLAGS